MAGGTWSAMVVDSWMGIARKHRKVFGGWGIWDKTDFL
jgi:hypothetical protein